MTQTKRISRQYLPVRTTAIPMALIFWLYADRYNFPTWLVAVFLTLSVLEYIGTCAFMACSKFVHPKDL